MPQKIPCQVAEILDHGDHVYSVLLKPETAAPRFVPGQFLHLALDPYQPGDFWPDSRAFSIVSPPSQREMVRITFAVKGSFTHRMEAELHSGKEVWVKMPYGEFTIRPGNTCLLAGGTGMTAFTAFLGGLTTEYPHKVTVFYGARRPDLLVYRPLVEAALERVPNLQAVFMAEEGAEAADCLPGRINVETVWDALPDPLDVTYYLAGPPEMLRIVTESLHVRGVRSDCIVIDAWE